MQQDQQGGVYAQFYIRSVPDKAATEKEGRPRFKDVPYVRKMVAGDPKNEVDRPANPLDHDSHRGAWEAFQKGEEAQTGTPLKEWPGVTRSQVDELAAFKVYTLEQLASVSDVLLRNVGPLMAIRQKARDFLEAATKAAPISHLQAQMDALKKQNEELTKRLEEQSKKKG